MTDQRERRAAYDRRASAWTYLVLGALLALLLGFPALGQDGTLWRVVGNVAIVAGAALVVVGLVRFQRPRP
jgi:sulfite exporter TauE/SafE